MNLILAALTLGFFGSFHCIGMCGPIAFALPVHKKTFLLKNSLILLYNCGRILTYSFLGLVAGIVGKSFALAGLQQALSILLGLLLLFLIFSPKTKVPGVTIFFSGLKTSLSKLFAKGNLSSLFFIGILNGFLPCGLVYMGLAAATVSGDISSAILFMTAFGLGTLPMMLLLPLLGNYISMPVRNTIRKASPFAFSILAILLVLRGLNLGIPYVSPVLDQTKSEASCHVVNCPVIK